MGRHDEAIAAARRGQELSPLTLIQNWTVGDTYFRARQIDKAIEAYKTVIELDKNAAIGHQKLGDAYAAKEMYGEAINDYQETIRLRGDSNLILSDYNAVEALLGAAYGRTCQSGRNSSKFKRQKQKRNRSAKSGNPLRGIGKA